MKEVNCRKEFRFSREFKDKVLKAMRENGWNQCRTAIEFGLHERNVSRWVLRDKEGFRTKNREYSKEFRDNAIRMVIEKGFSKVDVAHFLRIPFSNINRWVIDFQRGKNRNQKLEVKENVVDIKGETMSAGVKLDNMNIEIKERKEGERLTDRIVYSNEIRQKAKDLVLNEGHSTPSTARILGLSNSNVERWVNQEKREQSLIRNMQKIRDLELENKLLKEKLSTAPKVSNEQERKEAEFFKTFKPIVELISEYSEKKE